MSSLSMTTLSAVEDLGVASLLKTFAHEKKRVLLSTQELLHGLGDKSNDQRGLLFAEIL